MKQKPSKLQRANKIKILNLDYLSMCSGPPGKGLYGEDKIRKLLATARGHGINRVHFRTSVCGKVCYPSNVMTVLDSEYRLFTLRLAEVIRKIDPLATTVRICRELGLEIFAWVTLFDSYYPGLEDGFFAAHPECLMVSKDGGSVLRGIPCYAEKKTQQYRLKEARELAGYGVDGIFYSLHSHTICTRAEGDLSGKDVFGYNEPIVAEYQNRYGVDIRRQPFDKMKWYELHGEYFTGFLSKVKKTLRSRKLTVGSFSEKGKFTYNAYGYSKGLAPYPFWEQVKIHTDLATWVAENIVDGIVCHTEGNGKDTRWFDGYRRKLGDRVELIEWLQCGWQPREIRGRLKSLEAAMKAITESSLDGMIFHEAASFEAYPGLGAVVSRQPS